jgi:phosphohistidine phosphatase
VKRLTVLRHAKSSWDHAGLDDHNRPLNERGWKAAQRLGRELQKRGMHFDLVLASTAVRVRETLDGLQEHFPIDAEIRFDQRLYLASEESLLSEVRELPESARAPLFVGHNPGLERLIVNLSGPDSKGFRDQVAQKYPTGALAMIELSAPRWADIEPGSCEIVELILPRDLD